MSRLLYFHLTFHNPLLALRCGCQCGRAVDLRFAFDISSQGMTRRCRAFANLQTIRTDRGCTQLNIYFVLTGNKRRRIKSFLKINDTMIIGHNSICIVKLKLLMVYCPYHRHVGPKKPLNFKSKSTRRHLKGHITRILL